MYDVLMCRRRSLIPWKFKIFGSEIYIRILDIRINLEIEIDGFFNTQVCWQKCCMYYKSGIYDGVVFQVEICFYKAHCYKPRTWYMYVNNGTYFFN